MTDPLLSLRYPRIFGLHVVYTLLHPLRENCCAQVLWNVIFISAPEGFTLLPSVPHFPTCFARVINMCVWSLTLFGRSRL